MKITTPKLIFLFLTILMASNSYSQNDLIAIDEAKKDSLRIQANRMANAFLALDTSTFIKYSYTGVIDRFFNGERNVGNSLEKGKKDAEAMGFKNIRVEIGMISAFAKSKNELYTFIQTKSTSLIKLDTLRSESFYLAISKDNGSNWNFIDESFILVAGIKTLFPNYDAQIPLPKKKEPVFIQKNGS